ncbi:hypothetical protein C922_02736 [Plasmodium inui San Antonio 1]|uniref:DNA/RNA-binding protein Alba-like domain-containing protein n=1 Tax=Plasmodium inui San Antonio 1 TaxID=1237626 RepID=W7AN67_9APIC|nr:hypothetical protein C922_02736 [Plasmodium inui San Antonio 1]EUD66751.1 hypothetical protein C922_02736 [Plasmodium inui San Antonio 1]
MTQPCYEATLLFLTLESIQKEHTSVLQKKKTDVYITSGKPIKIYYDRIIKLLNSGNRQVDLVIDGDNRQANNPYRQSEEDQVVSIYAVGTNILRASYVLQDVINFYCSFIRKVQQVARKDKMAKPVDVFSLINVEVGSKTLHMNDTVISNTYTVKEEFLQDDYDAVIAFARQPYDPVLHKYKERTKERRVTGVVILIKKNPTML